MKSKILYLLVSLLALASLTQPHPASSSEDDAWLQWKEKHSKIYSSVLNEAIARSLWSRNWRFVQSHNNRSDVTFTVEMNQFADQPSRQDKLPRPASPLRYERAMGTHFQHRATPSSFDWRTKGVINSVRNQGQMGNSAAIAVTEDLESYHAINTGQLVRLSAQEVVDCCSIEHGMLLPGIYECIYSHGGLCSEADYPSSPGSDVCRNNTCEAVARDAKVTEHVPKGREDLMVSAMLKRPLVVDIDASRSSFQLYSGGVYSDSECSHTPDHAMQVVGYGTKSGVPYWILKNSWGAEWGMQGYILMKRGVDMCGVADFTIYPQ